MKTAVALLGLLGLDLVSSSGRRPPRARGRPVASFKLIPYEAAVLAQAARSKAKRPELQNSPLSRKVTVSV